MAKIEALLEGQYPRTSSAAPSERCGSTKPCLANKSEAESASRRARGARHRPDLARHRDAGRQREGRGEQPHARWSRRGRCWRQQPPSPPLPMPR